jgi:flagellar basal-body rod protein FlgB
MSISFDRALGIHPQALEVRERRAEVLANNLANADTPGYKARDLDFKAMLGGQVDNQMKMTMTSGKHLPPMDVAQSDGLKYRMPTQPSLDGNTVDTQQETAEFTKNVLDFQASFQLLNGKFKSLTSVLRGE